MSSAGALTLVVAVAASWGVALAGWVASDRHSRDRPNASSKRWRIATMSLVVASAIAAAIVAPAASVFWLFVALNFAVGLRENVPFSRYPMFSNPETKAWSLRFEDSRGQAVKIGKIGLAPHIAKKRFATELRAARERGIRDVADARRTAAGVMAGLVEQHRPPGGPLAACPITIVMVEYILESGQLRRVKIPILETSPQ
jgi:hypothetical protein